MRGTHRHTKRLDASDVNPATWRVPGSRVLTLRAAYALHGGSVTAGELIAQARTQGERSISQVASWIVQREAVQYTLGAQVHFPLFQFGAGAPFGVRDEVSLAIRELKASMDNETLAEWFLLSHPELHGRAPLECLASPTHLLMAAQATREEIGG